MGNDGGVVAVKRRFMRACGESKEKEDGVDPREKRGIRCRTCAHSNQPLEEPVVACEMGNLFNKEAVLNAMIDKLLSPAYGHIRALKDLKECKLTRNPEYDPASQSGKAAEKFICPVTFAQFDGSHPFVLIWSTGFVVSERALRELGIERMQEEYGPFSELDVVKLVPTEAEEAEQAARMFQRRKESKKVKKRSLQVAESKDDVQVAGDKLESKDASTNEELQAFKESGEGAGPAAKKKKNGGSISLVSAKLAAKAAVQAAQKSTSSSTVLASLFHKKGEHKLTDKQLFMTCAGQRYTLG